MTASSITIEHAMNSLSDLDAEFAAAHAQVGSPPPRHRPAGLRTFVSVIAGQQLSTKVAQVIFARVELLLPEMSAQALLAAEPQQLRDAGLSWRKVEYVKGLAEAVDSGCFDPDGLAAMNDEEAINAITALRGFGRWSAEIYLMFSLQRQDIFPADDLALQVGLGRLKGLEKRPTAKESRKLVEHWAPYRSAASLFLWHYYSSPPL